MAEPTFDLAHGWYDPDSERGKEIIASKRAGYQKLSVEIAKAEAAAKPAAPPAVEAAAPAEPAKPVAPAAQAKK